jgi:hypothetical protein
MNNLRIAFLFLLLAFTVFLFSCTQEKINPLEPVLLGTVTVTSQPSSISASWELSNDAGYFHTGSGSENISEMVAGNYTVVWNDVVGYTTPSSQSQELSRAGSISFTGVYEEIPPGEVIINPDPNSLNAPWVLSGPAGYTNSGYGDASLQNLTAGSYTLTWQSVDMWTMPNPVVSSLNLTPSGTITFSGTYLDIPPATININPTPDSINAPWNVTGPGGFSIDGSGDDSITGLMVGSYNIGWGNVEGWTSPSSQTQSVGEGGTIDFEGTFLALPSTLVINPDPDSLNASWTVSGPGGYSNSGSGDTNIEDVQPGSYTVDWADVSGWITPSAQTKDVGIGLMVEFNSVYEPQPSTIIIDPEPDSINAPWYITGPNGYSNSGNGDEVIEGIQAGDYLVDWGDVTGWYTPQSESQNISIAQSISFTGNYVEAAVTKIGIFVDSSGPFYSNNGSWPLVAGTLEVYVLLLDVPPSGISYWDGRFSHTGANTVVQGFTPAIGDVTGSYTNGYICNISSPGFADNYGDIFLGSLTVWSGTNSYSTISLHPYSGSYLLYSDGESPSTRRSLELYRSNPAFVIQ